MILGLVLFFTVVALMNPSQNVIFLKRFRFIKRFCFLEILKCVCFV